MPFIIVFNIIVCVLIAVILLVVLGCGVATKDNKKRTGEKAEITQLKIDKVRNIAYLVFLCVIVLMVIINVLF